MKELHSMRKHQGLMVLGFAAMIGLMAGESRAASVLTMTITWSGGSVTITPTSALALPGSTNLSMDVNTQALNTFLAGKLAYSFTDLGASSNLPGAANPVGGTLGDGGTATFGGTGATSFTITTTLEGYTAPIGTGTLIGGQTAILTDTAAGDSATTYVALNSTVTPTVTSTSTGPTAQFYAPSSFTSLSVPTGYMLTVSSTISLSSGADQFAAAAKVLATIPEPASIVMMLTGMPLPLAVLGLLRRRRAAA
jgi:hypothetical protein